MRRALLREDHIVVGLRADGSEEALRRLVGAVPAWEIDAFTKARILKQLIGRESVGTTAIGRGIALPHCFSEDVSEPVVVFGVSAEGIPYGALDGRFVHFVFALILPKNDSAEQMKRDILQNIKWFLCDRHLQERLLAAQSAQEVMELLNSGAVPEHVTARPKDLAAF